MVATENKVMAFFSLVGLRVQGWNETYSSNISVNKEGGGGARCQTHAAKEE